MPRRYTVEAGKQLTDTWALDANGNYLVSVGAERLFPALRGFGRGGCRREA